MTEAELMDLNHRIVERLRLLQHMRAHVDMPEFRIGERVTFQSNGRWPVQGMLVGIVRLVPVVGHGNLLGMRTSNPFREFRYPA